MSWSVGVPAVPAAEFEAAVAAVEMPDYYGPDEEQQAIKAAQWEQLHEAKAAVVALWKSGVVGSPERGYYAATLNGHATPGHGAPQGGSNDMVGVSVWQAHAPASPAPTEAPASSWSGGDD